MPSADRPADGAADKAAPISATEARGLFAPLAGLPALVIAVSGGPDSMALLALLARWRAARRRGPRLLAVTVDHGLRPEAAREARAVKRAATQLGIPHRILRWTGTKPASGLPAKARAARYALLAGAARRIGAGHVATAHTLDDQAETVVLRMARGSGLTGLRAMARESVLHGAIVVRPLLGIPKMRLIATIDAMGLAVADDPSNRDPRFTRPRLRGLMPALAAEGLTAHRLAGLAERVRRADDALEAAVDTAEASLRTGGGRADITCDRLRELPDEVGLRLLGRALAQVGDEGPVELGKLEALFAALQAALAAAAPLRRTLAGAVVTHRHGVVTVERAPRRRGRRNT